MVPLASDLDRQGPLSKDRAHAFLMQLIPFGYLGTTEIQKLIIGREVLGVSAIG